MSNDELLRRVSRPGEGLFFVATCPQCGGHDEVKVNAPNAMPVVVKKLKQKGWKFRETGNRPNPTKCGLCVRNRGEADNNPTEIVDKMNEAQTVPVNMVRIRFKTGNLIMEHWNEDQGRYHAGWSDERVSKESSLSIQAVKKMRETDLGFKQKIPPEVEGLENKISSMFDRLTELETEVQKVRQKYEVA